MSDLLTALAEAAGIEEQALLYGLGAPRVFTVSPPGAGNDAVVPVSQKYAMKVDAITFTVTASNVVATRVIELVFAGSGGNVFARQLAVQSVLANVQNICCFARFASSTGSGTSIQQQIMPDLWIPPGGSLSIHLVNGDVGDTITGIAGLYRFR